MRIIDISVSIDKNLPVWPGSSGADLHVGTHLDAPLHFIKGGKSIDRIPLEVFVGPAEVCNLKNIKDLPKDCERILFKTSNSKFWQQKDKRFHKNYIGLSVKDAKWLVKKKIKLVGIDYLSIAKFSELKEVHQILLKAGIAILESLDLSKVKTGRYQLISLPTKLIGAEAAPTRAILCYSKGSP